MAIRSHAFGGLMLSGKDARAFERQVKYGRPKKAAVKTAKRGSKLLREYEAKGYARVELKA